MASTTFDKPLDNDVAALNSKLTNPDSIGITSSSVTIISNRSRYITPAFAIIDYTFEKSGTISAYTSLGTIGTALAASTPVSVYNSDQGREILGYAIASGTNIYCANNISGGENNRYRVFGLAYML